MCTLCGALVNEGTWAERDRPAALATAGVSGSGRLRRAVVLNQVLVLAGSGSTTRRAPTTCCAIARGARPSSSSSSSSPDLSGLWAAAETMLGRPLDPLDPGLIAALERSAA